MMKYNFLKITFKENTDVWYEIKQSNYDSDEFSHIVNYPINKIEIDDIDSIYPIYMSEIGTDKTLIEIKGSPSEINLKYVKKEFLKPLINTDGKNALRYCEEIVIELIDTEVQFILNVHSPYSYISALKKYSTTTFNNISYAPGDLSPISLKESGVMQIDWQLEIDEDKKRENQNEVIENENGIIKLDRYFDIPGQYEWIDRNKEKLISSLSDELLQSIHHYQIADIFKGSCFYLSAGGDITPIIAFQDEIRTFVFCDEYDNPTSSEHSIEKFWLQIDEKLQKNFFIKRSSLNIDNKTLNIRDFHFNSGIKVELKKATISFWLKNDKLYCLLYLNWDNSMAFQRLYVDNRIIPKAICEILPDGGSIGSDSKIKIPFKFRMPEYSIGHNYSLGKYEEYELVAKNIDYYGEYDTHNGVNMYKRK